MQDNSFCNIENPPCLQKYIANPGFSDCIFILPPLLTAFYRRISTDSGLQTTAPGLCPFIPAVNSEKRFFA